MSGWSDIALRARATTVIPSAVMYKAHAVLTRGRSTVAPGSIWVKGSSDGVIRYVDSPANRAHAAHLVSGWQQDQQKAQAMLLGSYDLPAYMGHKPYFWNIAGTGYENMPDSVAGEPAIAFWRDVCASMCTRYHDDDVEMVQVDLRPGLYEGYQTNVRASKCDCYAYDDLAKLNHTEADPEVSHEAPNDLAMARFLSVAKLVNNYVGTDPHDRGLRYRRYINTYAIHRDPWDDFFVVEEQSTVFHKLALEPGYYIDPDTSDASSYKTADGVGNLGACMRECAQDYEHRMDFATMVFIAGETGTNCWCIAKDLLLPEYDDKIVHDPTGKGLKIMVYRTKLCVGVAGGSERSVVYRKGVKGTNAVCHGMPVGSGMVLVNGSVFLSKDASDDTRPIDIQCRSARCQPRLWACALVYRDLQRTADGTRPAASAGAAGSAAAASSTGSPAAPFSASPPPDGVIGLRTWSPASYNSAPEGPDDASNAFFYMYCGFGPSCGEGKGFRAPFHKSVSQLSILNTARNMIDQGTYKSSACPFECTRRLTRHEVVPSNEANMLSGLGLIGEGFVYPGHDDSDHGFSRFPISGESATAKLHRCT